jgi:sialic acid synthase SpsE
MKTSVENIYLSTGNSTINEIKSRVLNMKNEYRKKTTLIHTQFENNLNKINFNKIKTLKKLTKLNVAFGNHSKYLEIIKYSAKFEPCAIFFYVKSDFAKFFPDDDHAVNIKKINKLIKDLNT